MIPFSDSKSDTILGFINLLYSPTQIGVHIRCLDLHIPYDIFCQPFNTRLGRPTRDIEVITAILSMLPNLTTFTLSGVRPAQPNAPKSNVSITNSTRRLSVLLDNIGAGHDIQLDSLTEFDFSFSNSGQLPIASHTIRLAPNLRCLTLRLIPNEVFYEPPESGDWNSLALASATSLSILILDFTLEFPFIARSCSLWNSIINLLQLAPTSLTKITLGDFSCDRWGVPDFESYDWEPLRQALSRFSALESVTLHVGLRGEWYDDGGLRSVFDRLQGVVQVRLLDLHHSGKLQVKEKGVDS
ncbi:hypothetical protein NLI96_g6450 [Meripilus lineatus]|uniref:Uncharacterized protein n=1 Tax=Meripilus lineatus TaxID=2056292 RepID=A0AAD5V0W2_9APHY|nr:hypothetical protein NLI96_g6450 [Physisporinus lineatus]